LAANKGTREEKKDGSQEKKKRKAQNKRTFSESFDAHHWFFEEKGEPY